MPQDGRLNYNILILCFNRSSPKRKGEKLEKNQNIEQGFFYFWELIVRGRRPNSD